MGAAVLKGVAIFIIGFLLLVPVLGADKIRIVAVGMVVPGSSPIPSWMSIEPGVSAILVPNRYAVGVFEPGEAERVVRIYFPRTQEDLSSFDMIVFSGGNIMGFKLTTIDTIKRTVTQGMGGITDIGGLSSDPGLSGDWMASGIDDIFPNDVEGVTYGMQSYRDENLFKIRLVESTDLGEVLSMFKPLGIEEVVGRNAYRMIPREGSRTWAEAMGNWPNIRPRPPWLLSWKFGQGTTWAVADAFTFQFWSNVQPVISGRPLETTNRYALDIFMNLVYEGTGRSLPVDILLVHEVRNNLRLYHDTRSTMYEVTNFLEQFGANTNSLVARIVEIEGKRVWAEDAYLIQDFETSNELILEALEESMEIRDGIEELRNRTMFWIFLTEWSVVTGTMMIAGTAIYWLMVRRALYREVRVTRGV
jgi:hypothetical protein